MIQAYFLKNPGNFGPLFLKTLHCAAPLSGMNQHYYHMERGPRQRRLPISAWTRGNLPVANTVAIAAE